MFTLLLRKNINRNFINFNNNKRKLSNAVAEDKNYELSESSAADHEILCNKSGLRNNHRNVLHNKIPYIKPHSWIHLTEKYQRKIFARYGSESGISPNICFSTKTDKISERRYEEIAETETIRSMIAKHNADQKRKIDEINKREEEIHTKLQKLNNWKEDLAFRIQKKEADAIAAKEKKDRLIEEVRRHFGYKIDPKDERFKEVLEQKEKQYKKKEKEEKRKAKEQKLMSKLAEKSPKTIEGQQAKKE